MKLVAEVTWNVARTHGCLVRWPGGFWTYPSCPPRDMDVHVGPAVIRKPSWYVQYETIKSMLNSGILKVVDRHPTGFAIKVAPQ